MKRLIETCDGEFLNPANIKSYSVAFDCDDERWRVWADDFVLKIFDNEDAARLWLDKFVRIFNEEYPI